MTLNEFQQLFKDIRDSVVNLIKANTDSYSTKVYNRDVFDEDEATWLGRLTAADGSVHCWSVAYTGCAGIEDEDRPVATEIFVPTFRIIGYRGYEFGSNADNSSDKHFDQVNRIRWALMNNPTLDNPSSIESLHGFFDETMLGKIDSRPIHITRVNLAVQLAPIAYEYA